jgi:microcompartment protein CcmK/EutM
MILGKVVGTVVATISHPHFKHRRLLVVQPLGMDPGLAGVEGEKPDEDFIALDTTHAGIGDTVLVNREGNGARQVLNNPDACVISVIVGIVDSVEIG